MPGRSTRTASLYFLMLPSFFFNRYARKVSDVLVAAGQRIKEGGFSTVLVAGKGKKMTHCVTSPISMLAASSARMVRT